MAALEAGAGPVVVVVGADAEKVLATIQDLDGITICRNQEWKSGLATSLRAGLRAVRNIGGIDGVLVTVIDQPHVTARILAQLIQSFVSGHRLVAAEYQGVVGVPAVFGKEYFDELDQLSGDSGAGSWLRARTGEVTSVAVTEAALDIDSENDVQKLLAQDEHRPPTE